MSDNEFSNTKKELTKKRFGDYAAAYATSPVHAKGASLQRLVKLVQPQADWHVLDVATAAGHTAFAFAPHVAHVIASDLTPEMLETAQQLATERDISNISFELADAEDLPFEDGRFDLVTCRIAAHHFPNVDQFLAESVRVLKPGGLLAVVDNIVPDDSEAAEHINTFEKYRDPSHSRCLSMQEWIDCFEAAGLTVQRQETARKKMDFDRWAANQNAGVRLKSELKNLLFNATGIAEAFFASNVTSGAPIFFLTEGIIIGRTSS